ncbi:FAD-dependent oxidoreductase [Hydrocoleum sp. CS-953]|uniref:FAD-dependent oxidoreductase n=1 Tax=Hydrocoleum sp. CS-953 TaxID=1671698 RepID=UPI00352A62C8
MKKILSGSEALQSRQEFRNINNLGGVDVLGVRLWFDRKIPIPRASNACFGFDATTGWTFFDLNALHDEFRHEPGTVVEVDFYHANQFLPLADEEIIKIVRGYLASCISEFREAEIIDQSVVRVREGVTHFFPGSYQYLLPAKTSFENVFMSGDWIVNRHGSWSQEKAYVTGLEAANLIVDKFKLGEKANIIPVEDDEEHIKFARMINQSVREVGKSIFPDIWLP